MKAKNESKISSFNISDVERVSEFIDKVANLSLNNRTIPQSSKFSTTNYTFLNQTEQVLSFLDEILQKNKVSS